MLAGLMFCLNKGDLPVFRIVLISSLTLMAHSALAQEVRLPAIPQAMQASSGGMVLREVVVEGRKLLSPQDLSGFGDELLGTSVSLNDGLDLMRRLKAVYRQAGYGDITVRLDVNRFADGRVVLVVDESRAILRPALENPRPPLKLPEPPRREEAIAPAAEMTIPAITPPEMPKPVAPVEQAAPAPELPQVTPLREAAKNIYLIDDMPAPAEVVPVITPEPAPMVEPEMPVPVPPVAAEPVMPEPAPQPVAPVTTPTAPAVVAPVQEAPKVMPMAVPATPEVEAETVVERPADEKPAQGVVGQTIESLKNTLFGGGEKAAEE